MLTQADVFALIRERHQSRHIVPLGDGALFVAPVSHGALDGRPAAEPSQASRGRLPRERLAPVIGFSRVPMGRHFETDRQPASDQVRSSRLPVTRRYRIRSEEDIIEARAAGREMARAAGFSTTDSIIITACISELARNIVRYAEEGELTLTRQDFGRGGMRIEAIDRGPGISAEELLAAEDEGSGLSLASIRRVMDELVIVSQPGRGTKVVARKFHH